MAGIFLSSDCIFEKLITNVNYEAALAAPPSNPSTSSIFVVDKGLHEDWRHTSHSWRNQSTKYRVFKQSNGDSEKWVHESSSPKEMKGPQCSDSVYVLKITYFHHSNPKYKMVRRIIAEVQSFNANKFDDTNYALIQYHFPSDNISPSPKKRGGRQFIPTAPTKKKSNASETCGSSCKSDNALAVVDLTSTGNEDNAVEDGFLLTKSPDAKRKERNLLCPADIKGRLSFEDIPLPAFEVTGLPVYVNGSWQNAAMILDKDGIKDHPIFKDKCLTVSLSSEKCHEVSFENDNFKCDCEGFKRSRICAHVISTAHVKSKLDVMVGKYEIPSLDSQRKESGHKPGYKRRRRNISNLRETQISKQEFADIRGRVVEDFVQEERFSLVFLNDTKSFRCYGCNGKLRESQSADAPPPTFDIVLTKKTLRHFREKASHGNPGKLHIKTSKENVYYHAQLACTGMTKEKLRKLLDVNADVQFRMAAIHRRLLWNEFGIFSEQ